jgi:cytochrome c553
LGADTGKILNALAGSIQADDIKAAGRNLGTAAVVICARCHGVHRTLYDLKKALEPLQ